MQTQGRLHIGQKPREERGKWLYGVQKHPSERQQWGLEPGGGVGLFLQDVMTFAE